MAGVDVIDPFQRHLHLGREGRREGRKEGGGGR